MNYVKYFLKQTLFPLVYAIVMMMINFSILMLGEHLAWLKYLLLAATLALYAVIICAIAFKDGQDAVKIRRVNDTERLQIIKTGEDRPLNLVKEYKPWKGFVSGLTVCAPLVILLGVQAILIATGSSAVWPGMVVSCLYILVFSFFRVSNVQTISAANATFFFWNLIAIPVFALLLGVPYILGAKKQELLYKQVEDKQKTIYGDKN